MLREGAAGSLRDTDRLATAALRAAARKERKLVKRDILSRILQLDAITHSWVDGRSAGVATRASGVDQRKGLPGRRECRR